MSYKRILLKLSGESLSGDKNFGISVQKFHITLEGIQSLLAKILNLQL